MPDEIDSKFILFSPWTFIFIFLVIIVGNLFIIDTMLFSGHQTNNPKPNIATGNSQSPKSQTVTATTANGSCSTSCVDQIKQIVASITPKAAAQTTTQTTIQSPVKEYFIPLGSGSSTANDWTDVPGAQAYIDSTAYGIIQKVTFEVSLYTPTGNQTAWARLFNVTDSHPVWNSDVSIEGGTPQLLISSPISLDSGTKLYQVQMKTQLQSQTNLENARIHIQL